MNKSKKKPATKPMSLMPAARTLVDFPNNLQDCFCIILGSFGFSDHCIMRVTGLGASQVHYRLKKAGISRKAYRDGETALAGAVISGCRHTASQQARHLADIMRGATKLDIRAVRDRIVLMDR